jgi:hypothetical protein
VFFAASLYHFMTGNLWNVNLRSMSMPWRISGLTGSC